MQKVRIPVTNFQFGEISPSLISRTDTQIYTNSAQRLENVFIRAEGGVIKRAGLRHIYEFDTSVENTSFTITVTDYANIATGSKIQFYKDDGTLITVQFETAGSSSPSASVGNTHYVRANTDNNTTADNLFTAINAISGFTVSNPASNVVTVVRDNPRSATYLTVTSTDTTRLAVTNFSGGTKQQIRLLPFIFSDDERYLISLEHQKIRIFIIDFLANGTASSGAVSLIQTITTDVDGATIPFTDTYNQEVTYAQSGDVMFLAHQTFMIRKLTRTSLTTFAVSTFEFDTRSDNKRVFQPYNAFQTLGMTITPSSADSGTRTMTTSAAYFDTTGSQSGGNYPDSTHIGSRLRIHGIEYLITSIQSATQATGTLQENISEQLQADAFRTVEGSSTVFISHVGHGLAVGDSITIENAGAVGGIAIGNLNGARTIASVVSVNEYTITAGASATSSADGGGAPKIKSAAATTSWQEQSYSSVRGYPAAVAFHENRLWFGGTLGEPDGLWSSQSGEFFNFDVGTALDNESIQIKSSTGEINTIKHIVSNRDLQVFTSTSEFIVPAFDQNPVSPTNAMIRRQTPFGAGNVRPFVFDGATIYVQKEGSIVREFIYSDAEDSYVANAVSTISSHLIKNPVQMTTLQAAIDRAESYVFVLNVDGTIAVFNSNRAEKRAGWSEFVTHPNGAYHSICTIDEKVFVVGKYDKGDTTKKLVLMEFDSLFNLDMSKKYTGSSGVFDVSSEFANGAVLEVIDRTNYVGQFTVASGNINVSSVDGDLTSAEIGRKFDVNIKTNPIDTISNKGPVTGEPRAISKVILDLNTTLSVSVNGVSLGVLQVTDDLSQPKTPVTGKRDFNLLGYGKDPQVTVTQPAPLSLQVNGIITEVII
ncbi:MAG: hypothetical protein Tp139DCM904402_6 [Prokaryotic dsDNA virus sp.]|jgi:hypothetical protein|nr:MAG: hypothetical protein Tp139DCM904402_6 [Prokaryotic dsDNA virus sp.]|tara:strand:+ start:948 stop:3581 length:2634 start_codon:yes stop_codon:yes gene_type:complete